MKHNNKYSTWVISIIILLILTILSCQHEATYTLTVIHQGNGTTNPDGEIIVNQGEAVSITATPYENWYFRNWEVMYGSCEIDDVNNPDSTVTLTYGNAVVQAYFEQPTQLTVINDTGLGQLVNVEWHFTSFGNIEDGESVTQDVTTGTDYLWFTFGGLNFRTIDIISVTEGESATFTVTGQTYIMEVK